uniref:Uncharacterized protein n=1 Tax=Scherffelia dubia TaxID=3190 RepID=A0A142BYD5_SCHDU|nr:hypothetical protein [Scherffelia dubia]YP_009241561.1 hypothetical protein [Scherffelia dubia]AMP43427.1 hypothetical protein [Scherffelia dubia]AMP43468.1 hypothetical protein [Scherffelia dubia]
MITFWLATDEQSFDAEPTTASRHAPTVLFCCVVFAQRFFSTNMKLSKGSYSSKCKCLQSKDNFYIIFLRIFLMFSNLD